MKKSNLFILVIVAIVIILVGIGVFNSKFSSSEIKVQYPFNKALFPSEFPAPTFTWIDKDETISNWLVKLEIKGSEFEIVDTVNHKNWLPSEEAWNQLKQASATGKVKFTVTQLKHNEIEFKKQNKYSIKLFISDDKVGAPILYREIPLPFAYAEQHPEKMSYRLVNPGSAEPPHYAMKKFMVCGNCHSISNDGQTLGLDFDAAKRDKGGYFIADILDTVVFDTTTYLSWNKLQDRTTFGMFSKLSPDGRYVATTIKDRVVSEHFGLSPEVIPFSQLFFPVNGVLAIYDRKLDSIWELEGANLDGYVQSNAFWAPDGKTIYFSRAKALPYTNDSLEIKVSDKELLDEFIDGKRGFKFDVCSVPFNNGKGGEAKPVEGASQNGKSNYFPAVSSDGKWLVFCQSESFMLLQPDSKLYIIPVEGGKARKLHCNLPLFNSWHSWAPNSNWMVFASKGLSVYTDMFLTRIDEKGNASVPVLIEKSRVVGMAANYPEFVNIPEDSTFTMLYKYVTLDHISFALSDGDTVLAKSLYEDYLKQDQYSLLNEYLYLAGFNMGIKRYDEALRFYKIAAEKFPESKEAEFFIHELEARK